MKAIFKKIFQPSLFLTLVLVVFIIVEAYLLYSKTYLSLDTEIDLNQKSNIVRLDLASYNKTLDLLDSYINFIAASKVTSNPFK